MRTRCTTFGFTPRPHLRWVYGFLILLCSISWLLPSSGIAKEKISIQNTVEWNHLVSLWHVMLDHSSNVIYSPERFKEVAPLLERADTDITALITKGVVTKDTGESLRWIFHTRHDYIKDQIYGVTATRQQDNLQAAASASQWTVEMQLDVLRQLYRSDTPDKKLLEAVRSNLTLELTFQRRLTIVQGTVAQTETASSEDTKQSDAAQVKQAQDAHKQRQSLMQAYEKRKLPRDRAVQDLLPYIFELTKAQPG